MNYFQIYLVGLATSFIFYIFAPKTTVDNYVEYFIALLMRFLIIPLCIGYLIVYLKS
jgi:hypothetical protein